MEAVLVYSSCMQRIAYERATRAAKSLLAALLVSGTAWAQSLSEDSGPLSEISRSLKEDSRPVHERGRTLSDHSVGSMRSGPVRGGRRASMLSGPVSDVSVGPVTAGRSMAGGGSVSENSQGAVKNELDPSFGEQVYDLQRALAPLQERLRQQADEEKAALEAMDADDLGDEPEEPDGDQPQSAPLAEEGQAANDEPGVAQPDAARAAVVEEGAETLEDGTDGNTATSGEVVDQPTPEGEDSAPE